MRILRIRAIVRTQIEPKGQPGLLWIHTGEDEEEVLSLWEDGEWKNISGEQAIYFGDTEPVSKKTLWVSNVDTSEYNEDNTVIQNLYRRMNEIENSLASLVKLTRYGIIAGDSESSTRVDLMNAADPIDPNRTPNETPDNGTDEGGEAIEPNTEGFEPTVPAISIKMDTSERFVQNIQNLVDGELLWVTNQRKLFLFLGGEFIQINGAGGGGSGVSIDEIMAFFFDYLGFHSENGSQYRIEVDNLGHIHTYYYKYRENVGPIIDSWTNSGVYIAPRLNINSIYCGGEGDEHSYQSCSHNFVELANGGTEDVNLTNLYLLYAPENNTAWKALPLKGIIRAGGTFLIRGAQCSVKTNTTIVSVDDYDMEWIDTDGKPIKFSQTSPTFYLVCSEEGKFYNDEDVLVPLASLPNAVYRANTPLKGYVDSVGINTGSPAEGSKPISITTGDNFSDLIFIRYYTLDPVSQANKAYASRTTNGLWTYVNLTKDADEDATNPLYYYSKNSKLTYTPKAAKYNKNIFTTKSVFREDVPNMVNITFGIQATDSGSGATRCFNWVSVGYYDEFLEYKKASETEWTRVESIHQGGTYDQAIATFIDVYKRRRWITTNNTAVTTHKVIVKGLTSGDYQYRVGRIGDESYYSETMSFTVRTSSSITSFEFVQVSDQQGFNWLEYQAWKKAALTISKQHPNIDFTINTGDITQNGNRESEWLDYYDGRQFLRDKEEMFTIGNNDLCGVEEYKLGDGTAGKYKINHNNVLNYYTFELDPNNSVLFTSGSIGVYMPSLYSFNYGDYHFISLNSEWAANTYKVYTENEGTFKADIYGQMVEWFKTDLENLGTEDYSKCIVYCHEMPFTIVTHATMTTGRGDGRKGSKLNDDFTEGQKYFWSRLFKEYGIRLVIGGHKHTYSMSKPIYDAPAGYINPTTHTGGEVSLWGEVSPEASMQPVIQVTDASEMVDPTFEFNSQTFTNGRYELVEKIDAPVYVMCQATGYKLVSNQEIPCRGTDNPVWLKSYFAGQEKSATADNANAAQYFPTYIHYSLNDEEIKVYSYQVTNIYIGHDIPSNKAGSFNINNQSTSPLGKQEILGGNGYTITL